jgi:hypothetical protein
MGLFITIWVCLFFIYDRFQGFLASSNDHKVTSGILGEYTNYQKIAAFVRQAIVTGIISGGIVFFID